MYQVIINEKTKIESEKIKNDLMVNGEALDLDLQQIDENIYHVIYKGKSINLEIRQEEDKKFSAKINGKNVSMEIKDKLDLLLEKLGFNLEDANKMQTIKAPMPGLIVEVKVQKGDEVKKGDQLLILEAMKMENVIKSPGEGVVKSVLVEKGDGVEKNHVLIEF